MAFGDDTRYSYLRDPLYSERVLTIARVVTSDHTLSMPFSYMVTFAYAINKVSTWSIQEYVAQLGFPVHGAFDNLQGTVFVVHDKFSKELGRKISKGRMLKQQLSFCTNDSPVLEILKVLGREQGTVARIARHHHKEISAGIAHRAKLRSTKNKTSYVSPGYRIPGEEPF